jgi:hypothetical protein
MCYDGFIIFVFDMTALIGIPMLIYGIIWTAVKIHDKRNDKKVVRRMKGE